MKKTNSLKNINKNLNEAKFSKPFKPFNAKKFCGILKLDKDPLEIQKEMRAEWDERDKEQEKIWKGIKTKKRVKRKK